MVAIGREIRGVVENDWGCAAGIHPWRALSQQAGPWCRWGSSWGRPGNSFRNTRRRCGSLPDQHDMFDLGRLARRRRAMLPSRARLPASAAVVVVFRWIKASVPAKDRRRSTTRARHAGQPRGTGGAARAAFAWSVARSTQVVPQTDSPAAQAPAALPASPPDTPRPDAPPPPSVLESAANRIVHEAVRQTRTSAGPEYFIEPCSRLPLRASSDSAVAGAAPTSTQPAWPPPS
jgi:hypothetical protein